MARSKNRLKSLVRRRGIACTGEGIYQPEARGRWLRESPADLRSIGELLGVSLDCVEELKGEAEEALVHEASTVLGDSLAWTYPDAEHSEVEQRWITIGESEVGRILVVAHTDHGEGTIRIFSARRATRKEREFYEEA